MPPKKPVSTGSFNLLPATVDASQTGLFNLMAVLAGKSPETQRKYIDWLRLFYRNVLDINLEDMTAIPIAPFVLGVTPAAVESWLNQYSAAGHSKSGLGQARAAVVLLTRMLVLAKQAPSNLWHDLQLVSLPDNAATGSYGESAGETSGARWLSPSEVITLYNAALNNGQNRNRAARDAALIWIMVSLGLRRDEAAHLQWQFLTRRGGNWALRIKGKRNKWRAVAVPPDVIDKLQPWALSLNGGKPGMPEGLMLRKVFRSGYISDAGISGNAVWRIVTESWAATGLPGDLAPHDLRRTAAAIALDAGASEREIQQMLGHSSIETTMRYLAPMRENTASYRIAGVLSQQSDNFWGT